MIRFIPIACFFVSQLTILVSYLIAAHLQHPMVLSCNPFIDGCLNITDAGIYDPEGFIFRGGMITACVLFIIWWLLNHQWFSEQGVSPTLNKILTTTGVVGSFSLIVSTVTLYPPRTAIDWDLHVPAAILFFLITFIAQAAHLMLYKTQFTGKQPTYGLRLKWISVVLQGLLIAIALGLKALDTGENIGNAIEWWLALLVAMYYLSTHWSWRSAKICF